MNKYFISRIRNISLCLIISFLLLFATLPIKAQERIEGQKNDIKITLLSLGSGSSRFTYERAFGKKFGAEFTVGVIGWGVDILNHASPEGILFKLAPKWNIIPSYRAHSPLAGFYLKPEFVYANFDYDNIQESVSTRAANAALLDGAKVVVEDLYDVRCRTQQWALMAECGYQLVHNWFVFDIYCGFGPSFGTGNQQNYFHGFMLFPAGSHFAATSGFRLGVAF